MAVETSTKPKPKESSKHEAKYSLLIVLLFLAIALWITSIYLSFWLFPGPDFETRGQFGDYFGALNALFTGVALAALIFSIYLQRKDLQAQADQIAMQTEQLAMQSEELKLQRLEMDENQELIRKQTFENLFFNCLKLLSFNAISNPQEGSETYASKYFTALHYDVRNERIDGKIRLNSDEANEVNEFMLIFNEILRLERNAPEEFINKIKPYLHNMQSSYFSFKNANTPSLNGYLRTIRNTMQLIEDYNSLDDSSSTTSIYIEILLSQIDQNGHFLMAMDYAFNSDSLLKEYIPRYHLLRYLNHDESTNFLFLLTNNFSENTYSSSTNLEPLSE
ncbi:putative phage abortive infection protein [Rubellicoccus peritrichatus]|uniref:Phage abortive infection protein n=1 Tax=Rubellicoccus peritrichatus TaxID=3080537 RepID=A0AAQ3LFZ6_9BACT|nr:putative phage abortive infection protein [Puniceicoccus sp. CR14]WOO43150.1 putative phage abortive infection protein [Puniceicoccus sp. CR14]